MQSELLALVADGGVITQAEAGDKVEVVTAATPFYVEAGGEVSDTGTILSLQGGAQLTVADVRRPVPGLVVHAGTVAKGRLEVGQRVLLKVDDVRRADIRRNHTATHLLHRELRQRLGEHVTQAGSLVAPDRLRFDFTHPTALSAEELADVERAINEAVLRDYGVEPSHRHLQEAIDEGAMALFGEKYGEIVRTIRIGADQGAGRPYSLELCGGLHVSATGEIGLFRFTGEEAVAAGVRRVEAVTGHGALEYVNDRLSLLHEVSGKLNVPPTEVSGRVSNLLRENRDLQKELEALRRSLLADQFADLPDKVLEVDAVRVLATTLTDADADGLRQMADRVRDQDVADVAVLATVKDGRALLVAMVQKPLIARGVHAGNLIRQVAQMTGGGGGGRPDMAQAGGRDANRLPAALAAVPDLVRSAL
jgi:alanyl-tRNA synthetase